MNTFHFLTQYLNPWQSKPESTRQGNSKSPKPPHKEHKQTIPQPVMLIMVVVSLTSVFGYRFYNQPQLKEGTTAPKTIWAEKDATVVDEESTEEKRKAAQTGSVRVLKISPDTTQQITQEINTFLEQVEQMRNMAGRLPFIADEQISLPSQRYLRSSSPEEWQGIIQRLEKIYDTSFSQQPLDNNSQSLQEKAANIIGGASEAEKSSGITNLSNLPSVLETDQVETDNTPSTEQNNTTALPEEISLEGMSLAGQEALRELKAYGDSQGEAQLQDLLSQIELLRQGFQEALQEFENPEGAKAEENYKRTLLDLRDRTWEKTRDGIRTALDRILTQGIPQGMPDSLKREAIATQLKSQIPALTTPLATDLLSEKIQPNLVEDQEATKQLAEQAAEKVEPVQYQVEAGDLIVRAGETIDRQAFVLLDEFDESRRGIDWKGIGLTAIVVTGGVGVFMLVKRRTNTRLRCRDRILLCLLSVTTPLLMNIFKQNNLPAVGLLVSSFYNPSLAVTQVSLLTGLSVYSNTATTNGDAIPWESLLAGTTGGLLAAFVAGRLRSREELALLGGGIGLAQGTVYLTITLVGSATAGTIWSVLLPGAAFFGVSGLAWCIVALGLSPYLEKVFDLITPIRLAELSNPNRPLLKRLATEAPGTFQHTLFVASLAEAAARELHANVELVRAGTLYHDIGKMHDPQGFIENQMGGPNKHDEINDPWESADIIKKHVSQGLVMARKYNLPKALRDFIPEHQGTILISYFYFQAKQKAQAEGLDIQESDFRYDGPIPQSRETGIVMLADACEAALRSLKDATPETALNMVNKIFKARWQDGQLVDAGLKREELSTIAEVFVRVWQQYNHQRIAYPKGALDSSKTAPSRA
ncbi:HD family phosphohydrolase [Spirulina sp. CS-785/01]|uniref:HD family phosphohydrolase n=1 Tax=Spirulina sp. CS-785/01 TaxID=3021716 RepID=UPI00232FE58F|nr:HD family phosphohydrolase [Spirulina sp. CS-785/01]MDB9314332.1 HD family phosphohydrolase [Spirulina sp. CS-785/01]